jgi:hypothetical protein
MFVTFDCVNQETTTAGTGDFSLGSTVAGFRSFADVCSAGDVFCYEAHAVDAQGARTGPFEVGIGQFFVDGATPKIRRLRRLGGSAPGATPIDFGAGTKRVSITVSARQVEAIRLPLADAAGDEIALYVRSDGDDANSGLANTAGQAFLTVGAALAFAFSAFPAGAFIYVGPGSFGGAWGGYGIPGRVAIIGAGVGATVLAGVAAYPGQTVEVEDLAVAASGAHGLYASGVGATIRADGVEFGACDLGHVFADDGGRVTLGEYSVSGGSAAGAHWHAGADGRIICDDAVTVSDDIALAAGWAACPGPCGMIRAWEATIALGGHTVSGQRYSVAANSVIDTGGGGAAFLPGDSAGSTASGGQYL